MYVYLENTWLDTKLFYAYKIHTYIFKRVNCSNTLSKTIRNILVTHLHCNSVISVYMSVFLSCFVLYMLILVCGVICFLTLKFHYGFCLLLTTRISSLYFKSILLLLFKRHFYCNLCFLFAFLYLICLRSVVFIYSFKFHCLIRHIYWALTL